MKKTYQTGGTCTAIKSGERVAIFLGIDLIADQEIKPGDVLDIRVRNTGVNKREERANAGKSSGPGRRFPMRPKSEFTGKGITKPFPYEPDDDPSKAY
ncbi:MAG: hypothetical protein ACTSX6_04730 [Candidatus Heimdallarchaeaceae archaeon]